MKPACLLFVSLSVAVGADVCLAQTADLPSDVVSFSQDRDQCDHFRGEEADDPARQQQIAAAVAKYCKGTDKKLKALKEKYRNAKTVMQHLGKYELNIE